MTHDFIHTSLYCRFERLLSANVIKKGGVAVIVFKISDLETSILHHFRLDLIMAFYEKRTFFGTSFLHKIFYYEKMGHNFFFKKLTQYGSMIAVYIKAKI